MPRTQKESAPCFKTQRTFLRGIVLGEPHAQAVIAEAVRVAVRQGHARQAVFIIVGISKRGQLEVVMSVIHLVAFIGLNQGHGNRVVAFGKLNHIG